MTQDDAGYDKECTTVRRKQLEKDELESRNWSSSSPDLKPYREPLAYIAR